MDYEQAMAWVNNLQRASRRPTLAVMQQWMAALGNAPKRLPCVHLAGTNGKGSTAAMIAAILQQAGYKTGLNQSPFVVEFRERIQIDGQMVPKEQIAHALTVLRKKAAALPRAPLAFEAVTAAALYCFAQSHCDIVVLEAGIGARHDATNVVQNTQVACLTKIGYDHTAFLGHTLREIADNKCDIIKNHCITVSEPQQPSEVADVIQKRCAAAGSPLVVPSLNKLHPTEAKETNAASYDGLNFQLAMLGRHQLHNAMVAIEAARALRHKGYAIQNQHIVAGLAKAYLPARIEVLRNRPPIIVDGAHTEDAARALADALQRQQITGLTAVAGMMADKKPRQVVEPLLPFIRRLGLATLPAPRGLAAAQVAEELKPLLQAAGRFGTADEALRWAMGEENSGVLVFGSLYLAADARRWLVAYLKNQKKPL